MTQRKRLVFLAAGGTGGHLFPAQALAEVLSKRGCQIDLLTDERVKDYGKNFPAERVHVIPSASLSLSQPMQLPKRLLRLGRGYMLARSLISHERPRAIVGFGGYPSLPPVMAGAHLGVPSFVHEQNAVLGRANRLLASRVTAIATSFETVLGVPPAVSSKVSFTGNPVRALVLAQARAPYDPIAGDGPIQLVVFGGSQGAKFFSDRMPAVLDALPQTMRSRLNVTQQCRPEDMARVREAYAKSGITARLESFFGNMPELMAKSHLVICRSGASTIAELGVIGRPAILVPLPGAIDNDQLNNAKSFERAGAGFLMQQKDAETPAFPALLEQLIGAPQRLKQAAAAALQHGKPEAAERLAALVEQHISP